MPTLDAREGAAPADEEITAKARIFEALERLLVDNHPDAVSLRQVAREAGVSHGLPGYYYGDRSGLLTAFAAEGYRIFADLAAETAQRFADEPPATRLAEMGLAYLGFAERYPTYFSVIYQSHEVDTENHVFQRHADRAFDNLRESIRDYFSRIPGSEEREATVLVGAWSLAHGAAMLAHGPRLTKRLPQDRQQAVFRRMCYDFATANLP